MNILVKDSKHRHMRKVKGILHTVFSVVFIFGVLAFTACTPPIPADSSVSAAAIVSTATPPTKTASATQAAPETLTFIAEADARVKEESPDENYGNGTTLQVDGSSDPDLESFVRFNVKEVSGKVRSAILRVYATDNGTGNGPAVYSTSASWKEQEITWNTRPARTGAELDNTDRVSENSWVEYDVTSAVKGNGTFSFVLVADSSDAVFFSSRQGSQPPQLVVSTGDLSTTPPAVSTLPAGAVVFVGAGDIASCRNDNDEKTAKLLDNIPGTVFTTGDNAYNNGTATEFRNCYDPTWGRHKDRTRPVPGNHDYHTSEASGYFQYFDEIDSYYAYDLGKWRIYALNSEIDMSATSAQVLWLQTDLTLHPNKCVLAYWHRPRWASGEHHGSNREVQTLWEVLYEAGAELVLNGHEHNYERFAPMDAHGRADSRGMREIIVGTGGREFYDFGNPLPASEVRNSSTFGVLKLILRENGYDWQFIPVEGSTFTDSGSTECH